MNFLRRHLRLVLELLSVGVLAAGIWQQRHLLVDSWDILSSANKRLVLVCFLLVWLNYLWSATSYALLAPKIRLRDVYLAHLAASGPGRIIPGGGGHLSFGILLLKKSGYRLSESLAVGLTNNVLGIIVNAIFLFVIFFSRPTLLQAILLSDSRMIIVLLLLAVLVSILVITATANKTKTAVTVLALKTLYHVRIKQPYVFFGLMGVTLATIGTNALILYTAGHSLGLHISYLQAVVATSLGAAAGSILPTPGGIGGVEAGLIVTLTLFGYDVAAATAVALLYRASTYMLPFLPGCLAYVHLRRKQLL